MKPVKSFFSIGVETVASPAALADIRARFARLDQFFLPLERLLQRFAGEEIGTKRLIAEELLKGEQVTVEGYAFQGEVTILGVVDSIMFPGTRTFARFDYPSALPESVQARMAEIATRLMAGIGFDNGMFNIEMMYDAATDRIGIIEINPRMASQFADLYEKVDGTNSYCVSARYRRGAAAEADAAARRASLRRELRVAQLRGPHRGGVAVGGGARGYCAARARHQGGAAHRGGAQAVARDA